MSQAFKTAEKNNFKNIELSSGLLLDLDEKNFCEIVRATDFNVIFHNYFPLPKENFVLNVASSDVTERKRSLTFILDSISLARDLGVKFYSFHAGFCVDISPRLLGDFERMSARFASAVEKITPEKMNKHVDIMSDAVCEIVEHAKVCGVKICIENNNLELAMYNQNTKASPLLMTNSSDISSFFEKNHGLGLLLDTGHLNVAAQTSNLEFLTELVALIPYTDCFHLSFNNGERDTNSAVNSNLPGLELIKAQDVITVIEVYNVSPEDVQQMINLLIS